MELAGEISSNYIVIGTITEEIVGYSDDQPIYNYYYTVTNTAVKQNIKLGGSITEIHGVNANIKVTGTDAADGVDINESNTEVDTGAGNDIIYVTGQYANINTDEDDD